MVARSPEDAAMLMYEVWRQQFPGPIEGTLCHPKWFALRRDLQDAWRKLASEGVLDPERGVPMAEVAA